VTIEPIGIVTLLIGLVGLTLRPPFLVYIFLCFTLMGSAAAFVLDSLGGTNVSPAHLLLGFLAIKLLSDAETRHRILEGLSYPGPGFWLLLTLVYALLSAYFLPRFFAGQTMIFSIRENLNFGIPLEPQTSNLTQSVYFLGDSLCFVVLCGYASTREGFQVLGTGALVVVATNLVFAFLDLATYFTNTTDLLAFVRNANYSLLNDNEVAGFKRIVGLFVETSSFSYFTLGFLAFAISLWTGGIKTRFTAVLVALSLACLVFSTSTTAYVGLAVFMSFFYLQTLFFAVVYRRLTRQAMILLIGAPILLALVVVAVGLNDDYSGYILDLLNTMVFNKLSTSSGVERSSWNQQALVNFLDTFGFGVGNGSMRASSFPLAVLASFGFVGTLIFVAFFLRVFFQLYASDDRMIAVYRQAARTACVAWIIGASISGALVDLGLPFFIFAALACSRAVPSHVEFLAQSKQLMASFTKPQESLSQGQSAFG
jgi:hypothetical protein